MARALRHVPRLMPLLLAVLVVTAGPARAEDAPVSERAAQDAAITKGAPPPEAVQQFEPVQQQAPIQQQAPPPQQVAPARMPEQATADVSPPEEGGPLGFSGWLEAVVFAVFTVVAAAAGLMRRTTRLDRSHGAVTVTSTPVFLVWESLLSAGIFWASVAAYVLLADIGWPATDGVPLEEKVAGALAAGFGRLDASVAGIALWYPFHLYARRLLGRRAAALVEERSWLAGKEPEARKGPMRKVAGPSPDDPDLPADTPDAVSPRRASIADRLVSDRPLRAGDPDPLGYGALAAGVSRFLRNEKTQTPLTLAVTGEWGTGKSSIMSLLQDDLRRFGYRPVWFNAWHHQQEEHLLAALLETMRVGAFAPFWTPSGFAFRLRLFGQRMRRRPGMIVVITALAAIQLGLILGVGPGEWWRWVASVWRDEDLRNTLAALPGLGALAAAAWTMRVRLSNSLLDPARLTAQVGRLVGIGHFRDRLSFRHRFGAEFRDVTAALKPRSLVILIDDLDRCRPESVLEVLEAVNFLVSSGDCVVVMGLDRQRVVDCVAYAFRDIASYVAPGSAAASAASGNFAAQRDFAEHYLEKLVNVEIAVPVLSPDAAVKLLREDAPGEAAPQPGPFSRRLRAGLKARSGALCAVAGIAAAGFVALGVGALLRPAERAPSSAGQVSEVPAAAEAAATTPWWLTALLVLAVSAVLADIVRRYMATRRDRLIASGALLEDSPAFADALEDWYPLMATRLRTPRALKRFVNRLRFMAMMVRGEGDDAVGWVDEASFVALATVDRCEPAALEAGDGLSFESQQYGVAVGNHRRRHGSRSWPPDAARVARFRAFSRGIVTRDEEEPRARPPAPDLAVAGS